MNISLILAHPSLGSFNHAIAIAAINALVANGHCVSFHDLYRERFDPVLPYEEIPKGADLENSGSAGQPEESVHSQLRLHLQTALSPERRRKTPNPGGRDSLQGKMIRYFQGCILSFWPTIFRKFTADWRKNFWILGGGIIVKSALYY